MWGVPFYLLYFSVHTYGSSPYLFYMVLLSKASVAQGQYVLCKTVVIGLVLPRVAALFWARLHPPKPLAHESGCCNNLILKVGYPSPQLANLVGPGGGGGP